MARKVDMFFIDVFDYETEYAYWVERERCRSTEDGSWVQVAPQRQVKLATRLSDDIVTETICFGNEAIPPRPPRADVQRSC